MTIKEDTGSLDKHEKVPDFHIMKRYRNFFESSRDAIVYTAINGEIIDFNQAYLDMTGYGRDEIRNFNCKQLTPEKWHEYEDNVMSLQLLPRGYSEEYEKEYIRKDGIIIPVSLKVWLLKDKNGVPNRLWTVMRDISDRKRIEEALKESEERYRLLVENTEELVYVIQDLKIVYANRACIRITGIPENELISRSITDFVTDSDRSRLIEHHNSLVNGNVKHDTIELKAVLKNEEHDLLVNAVRITWSQKPATLNFASDITSRKKMEADLMERESLLDSILQSTDDGIYVGTKEKEVIICNKRFYELWNVPPEFRDTAKSQEIISCMLNLVEAPDERHDNVINMFTHEDVDLSTVKLKDGRVLERFTRPFPFRGKKARLWSYRDITEKKKAEEALKESEEEYRTLVANIPGAAYRSLDDNDWTLLYISPDIKEISGRSAYDFKGVKGISFREICHADDVERIREDMKIAIDSKKPFDFEYRIIHADNTVRWVHDRGQAVYNAEGKVKHLDGIIIDITKRKEQDELLKKKTAELEKKQQEIEQLNAKLKIEATTDVLTGMYNRRVINEIINYEANRSIRMSAPFSIILLDTDRFKQINDTYGHVSGDELLKSEAKLLKDTLRKQDVVFRWGGDEFLLLLPMTPLPMAEIVAGKIIGNVHESSVKKDDKEIKFTLSLGITEYKLGEKLDDTFKRADAALYEAKEKGRDRFVSLR